MTPYLSIGPPEPPGVVGLPQHTGHPVLAALLLLVAAVVVAVLVWRERGPRRVVLEDSVNLIWLPAETVSALDGDDELDVIDFHAPPRRRSG